MKMTECSPVSVTFCGVSHYDDRFGWLFLSIIAYTILCVKLSQFSATSGTIKSLSVAEVPYESLGISENGAFI